MSRTGVSSRGRRNGRGFTLIEILIVVVIIGILAAMVVPKYVDVSADAQESAVKKDLQTIRAQIELYKFDTGSPPATLAALATDGYLKSVPDHPGDGNWVYTAATGDLQSSVNASW